MIVFLQIRHWNWCCNQLCLILTLSHSHSSINSGKVAHRANTHTCTRSNLVTPVGNILCVVKITGEKMTSLLHGVTVGFYVKVWNLNQIAATRRADKFGKQYIRSKNWWITIYMHALLHDDIIVVGLVPWAPAEGGKGVGWPPGFENDDVTRVFLLKNRPKMTHFVSWRPFCPPMENVWRRPWLVR